MTQQLQTTIDAAWEDRANLSPSSAPKEGDRLARSSHAASMVVCSCCVMVVSCEKRGK